MGSCGAVVIVVIFVPPSKVESSILTRCIISLYNFYDILQSTISQICSSCLINFLDIIKFLLNSEILSCLTWNLVGLDSDWNLKKELEYQSNFSFSSPS